MLKRKWTVGNRPISSMADAPRVSNFLQWSVKLSNRMNDLRAQLWPLLFSPASRFFPPLILLSANCGEKSGE